MQRDKFLYNQSWEDMGLDVRKPGLKVQTSLLIRIFSQPQNTELGRILYFFFDIFTVNLKTINHVNLKYYYSEGILQVLKFEFQKFRILEILNFHPWV